VVVKGARLVVAAPVLAAALLVPLQAAAAAASVGQRVVKATVTGHPAGQLQITGNISFAPAKIRRGTVTFRISNTDNDEHIFSINGVDSHWIKPRQTIRLTVTFKKPAVYAASCPDDDGAGIVGLLRVT
jgi:plastocyanin